MDRPAPRSPTPAARAFPYEVWLWGAALFGLVLTVYWPALEGTRLWDDDGHITAPVLRPLAGLLRIWFEPGATQQYYPLLHSAFWFESHLWGDNPAGYHLVNVLWHATSALLFGLLLRRLACPGAWIAALLFAVHPVGVESVAWISEQKNTLSLVFYLGAALAWLSFDTDRRPRDYALASALFVAALLTKSVTATLPAALLVLVWWRRGAVRLREDVVPLLPWFAASAAMAVVTARFERVLIGAQGAEFSLSPAAHVILACRDLVFYLGKLLLPVDLCFIYPRWQIDAGDPLQWLSLLAVLAAAAALVYLARRHRAPLAVFLCFAGTLFPALGFIHVFPFVFSYVADHFQYHAALAVFALAGAGLASVRLPQPWARPGLVAVLVAGLSALTWTQCGIYRNLYTLYEATLAGNPACWLAHNNLGLALVEDGRAAEALPHYERALKLRPGFVEAENNCGYALNQLGRFAEAKPHLEAALRLKPDYAEAHNNLGVAQLSLDETAAGIGHLEAALRLKPGYGLAHRNLGLALARNGRVPEALVHFTAAIQADPTDAQAEMNLGLGLTLLGRFPEGEPHLLQALTLQPDSPDAHAAYGRALDSIGRHTEARQQFAEAQRLASGQ